MAPLEALGALVSRLALLAEWAEVGQWVPAAAGVALVAAGQSALDAMARPAQAHFELGASTGVPRVRAWLLSGRPEVDSTHLRVVPLLEKVKENLRPEAAASWRKVSWSSRQANQQRPGRGPLSAGPWLIGPWARRAEMVIVGRFS